MKARKAGRFAAIFLLGLLLCGCGRNQPESGGVDHWQEQAARRCQEILSLYRDVYSAAEKTPAAIRLRAPTISQETMDRIDQLLLENGYDVLVSNGPYPSYLATGDRFREFLAAMERGEAARQEVVAVTDTGALSYWLFAHDPAGDVTWFSSMTAGPDPAMETSYDYFQLLDWTLTDRDNFYFRIRPAGDKHYQDYTLIRLTPPDRELYDWNRRCVLPIGYLGTNIFLTDWHESDWRDLSFSDLWDYLYYVRKGEAYRPADGDYDPPSDQYRIPAAEFEAVVRPYFDLDLEAFRALALYQPETDCYLWRPIETMDAIFLVYPVCFPEVTACRHNADGTLTLTVEALSTDLKTDCLFAHEVTIRPLADGGFQYVSNRVTFQTDRGLPFCQPRRTWE